MRFPATTRLLDRAISRPGCSGLRLAMPELSVFQSGHNRLRRPTCKPGTPLGNTQCSTRWKRPGRGRGLRPDVTPFAFQTLPLSNRRRCNSESQLHTACIPRDEIPGPHPTVRPGNRPPWLLGTASARSMGPSRHPVSRARLREPSVCQSGHHTLRGPTCKPGTPLGNS